MAKGGFETCYNERAKIRLVGPVEGHPSEEAIKESEYRRKREREENVRDFGVKPPRTNMSVEVGTGAGELVVADYGFETVA